MHNTPIKIVTNMLAQPATSWRKTVDFSVLALTDCPTFS